VSDLDRMLSDKVADGRITEHDVAVVLKFRDFLRQVGPAGGPLTDEELAFRQRCHTDPEWREFLGLEPTP
jgi:hypothetical protein